MEVPIQSTPLSAGIPRVVTSFPYLVSGPARSYDVAPDGRRFIVTTYEQPARAAVTELHVILNWEERLRNSPRRRHRDRHRRGLAGGVRDVLHPWASDACNPYVVIGCFPGCVARLATAMLGSWAVPFTNVRESSPTGFVPYPQQEDRLLVPAA